MNIGVLKERTDQERRVALVPAHISALVKAGHTILIESKAGELAGFPDQIYSEKGAKIVSSKEVYAESDILLAVRAGAQESGTKIDYAKLKKGCVLVAMMDPYAPDASFNQMRDASISAFSMELIPRITRAQSMDVLSSMANLAGYKGVLLGAEYLPKIFPMMMTAAGTITPAKVFVLGAGVAGLQAIATAKRLGSVVSAFDVRPAVKEQVQSLGGKFIEFDIGSAEGSGGYAKELSEEQKAKQLELMTSYVKDMDIIVSTAAIPGRPSPKLITEAMVKNMNPGSVIVDLASERGGNCELTEPGKIIVKHGVTIIGALNVPSTVPFHASQLYSKNLVTFLGLILNKEGQLSIDSQDEIIAACMILNQGKASNEKIAQTLGL